MDTSTNVPLPTNKEEDDIPQMGTLEAKFLENQLRPGIQFPKQQANNKKQPETPQQQLDSQLEKKKKKKKKKKQIPAVVHVPIIPQTPSASAKKRVSFSPRVVSTVAYTYSKQEYDRTPIMGIFNHFCDCCMEGIEGARFHCRLCENFDMCQGCFVTQGAAHIHGQAAFTCPELDELEEEDEGDEEELDDFNEFIATLAAQGGEEDDEEDAAFDNLAFRFTDENDDLIEREESSVRLADENGPLERITSEEAARLEVEDDTSVKSLFPKVAASNSPVSEKPKKAQKKKKPIPSTQPQENLPQDAKLKKRQKKASASAPLPQAPSAAATQPVGSPVSTKKTKRASTQGTQPVDLSPNKPQAQKKSGNSASPTSSPKAKPKKELQAASPTFDSGAPTMVPKKPAQKNASPKKMSPKKMSPSKTLKQELPSPSKHQDQSAPGSKKRVRTDGTAPKLKKQKLTSDSKPADFKFSFE